MKKIRDFKCDKCAHRFESFVEDDTSWLECINCGGESFRCLSSPKCFQNTTGKSPSVSNKL